jgi:GDP-L-fucose synthase
MKVYIAGHNGMVGRSIIRLLESDKKVKESHEIITRSSSELDLKDQGCVKFFLEDTRPDCVIIAAAKVGGILANSTYPADFIYENLIIESNLIHQSYCSGVKKLLFLGSSCIYPKFSEQPIKETELLTGPLEETNEPYAIAKISGIKLCESYNKQFNVDYRSVMPTNLYGPYDNFSELDSHVIPGILQRFHEAKLNNLKEVKIWGSGSPMREFLHVDDMASACRHILNLKKEIYEDLISNKISHINIGTGVDCSIKELAELVSNTVKFKGKIVFDASKPDGMPKKLLDVSLLSSLGWNYSINLKDGLEHTYGWFLDNQSNLRR